MGTNRLKITYDPVFKMIFNPEIHPSRLEEFLSLLLGQNVKILRVMPSESSRLTAEGSLLVMDILVLLESGELVNVEIQRVGYLFPGARCACYSSDLVMRQYSQVREACRRRHEDFSYRDIKKVYTIVLIEKVIEAYPEFEELYRQVFQFRFQTKELISMFSEALAIMDANTVKYMVEQQKKELEEQWEKLEKQRGMLEEQRGKLEEQQKELEAKDKEIQRLRTLLEKRQ